MKILALTPWPIYPASTGGTQRCYQLLQDIDGLTVLSLDWEGDQETKTQKNGVTYHVIPANHQAKEQARKLFKSVGLRSHDAIPSLTEQNLKDFQDAINQYDPDLIILEHPWLIDLIGERPYIYDAHNCETVATASLFGKQTHDFELVQALEQRCIREAEHITYCSETDLKLMEQIQHITCPTTYIPNGTNIPSQPAGKENQHSKQLIFVGSMYLPNAVAAQNIISIAPQHPDYTFTIVGGCCNAVVNTEPNVRLLGHITDEALHQELKQSHAFINLTVSGAGTQLKVAQALAYGLPVISTTVGARGYKTPLLVTQDTIGEALQALQDNYETYQQEALAEAETLNWENLRHNLKAVLNEFQ